MQESQTARRIAAIDRMLAAVEATGDPRLSTDRYNGTFTLAFPDGSLSTWIGSASFDVWMADRWQTEVHFDTSDLGLEAGFIERLSKDPAAWCERAYRAAAKARPADWQPGPSADELWEGAGEFEGS